MILKRAELIKEKRARKRRVVIDAVSAAICLVLLVGASFSLPHLTQVSGQNAVEQYGSLILGSAWLGYVVIGILAFALGVCIALLCVHWRGWKQKERDGQ